MKRTAVALILLAVAAGCGGGGAAVPPHEAEGYITSVAGSGSDVPSFTLQVGTREYTILIDPELDYGFDLRHLRDHERRRLPVLCILEQRGDETYAIRIDDVAQ